MLTFVLTRYPEEQTRTVELERRADGTVGAEEFQQQCMEQDIPEGWYEVCKPSGERVGTTTVEHPALEEQRYGCDYCGSEGAGCCDYTVPDVTDM